jgi:hypothetical protein
MLYELAYKLFLVFPLLENHFILTKKCLGFYLIKPNYASFL